MFKVGNILVCIKEFDIGSVCEEGEIALLISRNKIRFNAKNESILDWNWTWETNTNPSIFNHFELISNNSKFNKL